MFSIENNQDAFDEVRPKSKVRVTIVAQIDIDDPFGGEVEETLDNCRLYGDAHVTEVELVG